jgi:hypothetical protein
MANIRPVGLLYNYELHILRYDGVEIVTELCMTASDSPSVNNMSFTANFSALASEGALFLLCSLFEDVNNACDIIGQVFHLI